MEQTKAIEGALTLAALLAVIYGPWQWYCTDKARQKLFFRRAELFDIACNGEIEFSDPAYMAVRLHIERLIRFAHGLTWVRFLILLTRAKAEPGSDELLTQEKIAKIVSPDTRDKVQKIYDRSVRDLVAMLIQKSPLLLTVVRTVKAALHLLHLCAKVDTAVEAAWRKIATVEFDVVGNVTNIVRREANSLRI